VYLNVLRDGLASQASEDEKWLAALQNSTAAEERYPCKGLPVAGRILCGAVASLVQHGRVSVLRHSGRLLQGLEQRLNKNLAKRLGDFNKVGSGGVHWLEAGGGGAAWGSCSLGTVPGLGLPCNGGPAGGWGWRRATPAARGGALLSWARRGPTARLRAPGDARPTAQLPPPLAAPPQPPRPSLQPANGTNPACDLAHKLASRVLGSESAGPVTGDVLGQAALEKLDAWGTNAAASPAGARWWSLPKGVKAPELEAPCAPLATVFPDFVPSLAFAGNATAGANATAAADATAASNATGADATAPKAPALPRRVGPGAGLGLLPAVDAPAASAPAPRSEPAAKLELAKAPDVPADAAPTPVPAAPAGPAAPASGAAAPDAAPAAAPQDIVIIGESDVAPVQALAANVTAPDATADKPAEKDAANAKDKDADKAEGKAEDKPVDKAAGKEADKPAEKAEDKPATEKASDTNAAESGDAKGDKRRAKAKRSRRLLGAAAASGL
jgi:hypothetical protein